jgi:peptidoglycan/xylan/chitin deacetylase (PgdA/CDA1 family)
MLHSLRTAGVFRLVRDSRWRRQRLLVLCYHGISLHDEHLWRPLYMEPSLLQERLEMIKRGGYQVLPLGRALQLLQGNELPPRSVVLTFDDGMYDFYKQAYPLLKSYRFPVTVYQTTYYSELQKPIFNLICSYMLWKRRGAVLNKRSEIGFLKPLDLRTEESREKVVAELLDLCAAQKLNGAQKNELAERLAKVLDIDYGDLLAKRLFRVMSPQEIAQLATEGVDFQLHTHRHRAPADEKLFRAEIQENRRRVAAATKSTPTHFCYPSGVYRPEFLPWLLAENVVSATTCDVDLATAGSNPLLLPRFIDSRRRTAVEFESWLSGVGSWLAVRRRAPQRYD